MMAKLSRASPVHSIHQRKGRRTLQPEHRFVESGDAGHAEHGIRGFFHAADRTVDRQEIHRFQCTERLLHDYALELDVPQLRFFPERDEVGEHPEPLLPDEASLFRGEGLGMVRIAPAEQQDRTVPAGLFQRLVGGSVEADTASLRTEKRDEIIVGLAIDRVFPFSAKEQDPGRQEDSQRHKSQDAKVSGS